MEEYDSDSDQSAPISNDDDMSSIIEDDYSVESFGDMEPDMEEQEDSKQTYGGVKENDDETVVSDVDADLSHLFNTDFVNNYIAESHPECLDISHEELLGMLNVVRNKHGIIIDDFHTTIPVLTKYERTRVLGQRAVMIENGARLFIDVPPEIIDSMVIAEMELNAKKIPFIIKRPLPNNGFEYWRLNDLEQL